MIVEDVMASPLILHFAGCTDVPRPRTCRLHRCATADNVSTINIKMWWNAASMHLGRGGIIMNGDDVTNHQHQ